MEHFIEPTGLVPGATAPATSAAPRPTAPRSPRLAWLIAGLTKSGRTLRSEIDARAEQAHDLLAGRVELASLKGANATPYLQGLDVVELRGQRLLEILAIRSRRGKRSLWRLSPLERLERLPDTLEGRRHSEWLDKLERAGLLKRPKIKVEKPWAG
jgi:hypothetical protein